MATLFWTLLMLYPFVTHSQSGDDGESVDTDCWSLMTLKQSSLICVLTEDDLDICEKFATLCPDVSQDDVAACFNATMKNNRFTFQNLSLLLQYKLHIHLKGGRYQTQYFNLMKSVKLPTPEIKNATYELDEAVIRIKYMHDYVTNPEFQVEFWGNHSNVKEKVKSIAQEIRIPGHKLRVSETYYVHVRAKPVGSFDGSWTEWSTWKSFKVKGESVDTDCWSLMTLKQSSLICVLTEDDLDICEKFATLCCDPQGNAACLNATMENNTFTFQNLSPVSKYKLHIHLKGGPYQSQTFSLASMVKITTPEIENATYEIDEAVIRIEYMHGYVTKPEFQVEFWGEHSNVKEKVNSQVKEIRIGGHKLRDSETYHVRVRAKPVKYFNGSWTEWSTVKSFKVNHTRAKGVETPPVLYILLCTTPVALLAIGFLILRFKKEIQACLCPDIPDPKATLAQIYRQKEHLPVSFSPEIFKDTKIYPVVFTEENQFTPEFGDDQGDTTESCDDQVAVLKFARPASVCDEHNEDDQSLDSETSQIKMKLLDECASTEDVHDNPACQSVAALQRHSNDETYVTMSSLYKTQ